MSLDLVRPPRNGRRIHHAVCPVCREPMNDPKATVFHFRLGECHIACITFHIFERQEKPC